MPAFATAVSLLLFSSQSFLAFRTQSVATHPLPHPSTLLHGHLLLFVGLFCMV